MLKTTLETVRVPVRLASPKTTWPVICDACGRYGDPRELRVIRIGRVGVDLCQKCWAPLAA